MLRELTIKNIGAVTYDLPVKTAYQAKKEAKRRFGDDLLDCTAVSRPAVLCHKCDCKPCCCPIPGTGLEY
jgi:hypothetical protein